MSYANFTTALSEAKRKAALQGRPITKQETSGIAAGFADTANARLTRGRQLELQESAQQQQERLARAQMSNQASMQQASLAAQERQNELARQLQREQLAQQKALEEARMAEQQRITNYQMEQAEDANKWSVADTVQTGLGGVMLAKELFGEGGFGSDVVSWASEALGGGDWSWLCDKTAETVGISFGDSKALAKLRKYASDKHGDLFKYYLKIGPELVKAIDGGKEFYGRLKKALIGELRPLVEQGDYEGAYQHYVMVTNGLIGRYMPQIVKETEAMMEAD